MRECPSCQCCFPDDIFHCPDDGSATTVTITGEPILDSRYELEKRLGSGGMGVVYKARHVFLRTQHAIKVILPDLVGNDPQLVTRFRQEALALAAIRHQNIIAVTDFGVVNGRMPFLVMEFVQGNSLQDIMADEGAMSPMRAFELMQPICAGIAAAHRQHIVHRDLKPLNVMLQNDAPINEGLKILDFGLAKIKSGELLGSFVAAQTTGLMGSPFYMAPEQWSDEPPDVRADVYSLGVMLYQMLAGEVPFKGKSIPAIMKKHLTEAMPSLASKGVSVPPEIESVLRHALDKDPKHRTASADEFITELRAAMSHASAQMLRTGESLHSNLGETLVPGMMSGQISSPAIGSTSAYDPMAGTISSTSLEEGEQQKLRAQQEALAREAEAKQQAEAEARRRAEEQQRIAAEAAREAERQRELAVQEEQRRLAAAAEAERLRAENAARELAERERIAQEEKARHEASLKLAADEEQKRKLAAEEEAAKQKVAAEEAERQRIEAQKRQEEEAKQKAAEAEAEKQRVAEENRKQEEAAREKERLRLGEEEKLRAAELTAAKAREEKAAKTAKAAKSKPAKKTPVVDGQATHMQRVGVTTGGESLSGSPTPFPAPAVVAKKSSPLPYIAIGLLVLLLGGGAGGYFIYRARRPAPVVVPVKPADPLDVPTKADLVDVPGGAFKMGRDDGLQTEAPAHQVTVGGFAIDKTEVTNFEYAQFVKETGHAPPSQWNGPRPPAGEERIPVSNVSNEDAVAFAQWRSQRDHVTYRLPTEAEWEYAARNGDKDNLYPWGDAWQAGNAVSQESGAIKPDEVGKHPQGVNRWGVQDLMGNVYEWTSSKATLYPGNPLKLPDQYKDWIVIRGGGYGTPTNNMSGTMRDWFAATYKSPLLGFRLVRASS